MRLNKRSVWATAMIFALIVLTALIYLKKNNYYIKTDFYRNNELNWQILDVNKSTKTYSTRKNTYQVYTSILNYHYIRNYSNPEDQLGQSLSVSTADFENQMLYIVQNGYNTITLDDLTLALQKKYTLPENPVVITFDDGYSDFYTIAYPILKKYSLKATVFVIYDFLDDKDGRYLTTNQLKEVSKDELITIGSHSLSHANLANTSISEARKQILNSKLLLEAKISKKINHFCYPSGKFTVAVMGLVEDAGYTSAVSTQAGSRHSLDTIYNLDRVRISGGITIEQFSGKLKPEYTKK